MSKKTKIGLCGVFENYQERATGEYPRLVYTVALSGCAGGKLQQAARNQGRVVQPEMQQRWRCEGTLYYLPESGKAFCDGKVTVDIEGYSVKK